MVITITACRAAEGSGALPENSWSDGNSGNRRRDVHTVSLSRMLFLLSLLLSLGHTSWVLCRSHLSSSYTFRVIPGPLCHFPTGLGAGSAYGAEDSDVSELRSATWELWTCKAQSVGRDCQQQVPVTTGT